MASTYQFLTNFPVVLGSPLRLTNHVALNICYHVTLMSVEHKILSLNIIIDYFSLSIVSVAQ